jgi:V/A-type H+-transporting ATPase subunit B
MRLSQHSYSTILSIQGPLLFIEKVMEARMGEVVRIAFPDGREAEGEVLKIEGDTVLIQVVGDSRGLDMDHSRVVFTDAVKRAPLSLAVLNRVFGGSFQPIDGLPMYVPDKWGPIDGFPLNPVARARPQDFIETGFSTIDGLNTLVKGQKLPIFSCAGLPSREIAGGILQHARSRAGDDAGTGGNSIVVFVALGLTHHEYSFYRQTLERMRGDFVAFINLAKDPVVERLLAPRFGLTSPNTGPEHGRDVLSSSPIHQLLRRTGGGLRPASAPGRRGYPAICTRHRSTCRRIGTPGSVTLLPS